MTITQTVEIPADRRITLEVSREVPAGRARVELNVIPFLKKDEKSKEIIPLLALRGSCKGLDTMDAYFARKRADKSFEVLQITNTIIKRPAVRISGIPR